MSVIRREECPVHGVDYGMTTTIGANRWCQHCGIPANTLVMAEYVPAEQLRGAVSRAGQAERRVEELLGAEAKAWAEAERWKDRAVEAGWRQ